VAGAAGLRYGVPVATRRLEDVFRAEHGRILATLIRLLGDFDAAEEALQEAFAAALERWPASGLPANPVAWLVSTGRHKAIDRIRRRQWLSRREDEIARHLELTAARDEEAPVPEDRLRLIFTCCHPALAREAQVALTLRTLGGLTTEEIARAFLVPVPTMAQRLVRAKAKIRDARIPYQVPPDDALAERLDAAMLVVYLVFNEGYAASAGDHPLRPELCEEAIRLGRLLVELLPAQPEPRGLLALMLLHHARRATRVDAAGDLVLLEHQDRSRWDRALIAEGAALVERALRGGGSPPGPYALQAAIAALHAQGPTAADTDWRQIAALYGLLARVHPTPVVELNRAVAVAMAGEPERGLALVEAIAARGELAGYHPLPVARAELLRRLGRPAEAADAYRRALELVRNEAERRHLEGRLRELAS
jgi:RNA polymerase sigma-70 factor (ECF subfamily)